MQSIDQNIIMKAENISKSYKKVQVLDQVSLELQRGHVYGFIGNNGAGKTTFMRILAGLSGQDSGDMELFGERERKGLEAGRRRTGFLIEAPIFYPDMSAFQNLMVQGRLKGIRDKEHIRELLRLVGLETAGKKRVKDYSTGMKQRYGIAFALIGWPELLVLDEPLNGMDVTNMDAVMDILQNLNTERGITIFMSSHLLERLYSLATDFIFLEGGKILQKITFEELKQRVQSDGIENYFRHLLAGKKEEG